MSATLDLSSSPIRISEPAGRTSYSKFLVSFVGLIALGGSIAVFGGSLDNVMSGGQSPLISLFLSLAVLGFGLSSLLSWRQKSETQEIVVGQNFIEVRSSLLKTPLFHSPLTTTKIQRFQLPGGRQQIFLRNEEKALEIGQTLEQTQQDQLAQHLENVLGVHAPLGFRKNP